MDKTFFKNLVFARVQEIVFNPKKDNKGRRSWLNHKGHYTYYYGIASLLNGGRSDTKRESVFFQLSTHINKTVFIGPVEWYCDIPSHFQHTVEYGDILFGEVTRDAHNRWRYKWWSHKGKALYFFKKLLHYKSKQKLPANQIYEKLLFKQRTKKYRCSRCFHPAPSFAAAKHHGKRCELCGGLQWEFVANLPKSTNCQDLWVLYMLLVHNNHNELMAIQSGARGDSRISPFTKKTVCMSYSPQRFMFLLAWYCGKPSLYTNFVAEASGRSAHPAHFKEVLDGPLSVDNLTRLIATGNAEPAR